MKCKFKFPKTSREGTPWRIFPLGRPDIPWMFKNKVCQSFAYFTWMRRHRFSYHSFPLTHIVPVKTPAVHELNPGSQFKHVSERD